MQPDSDARPAVKETEDSLRALRTPVPEPEVAGPYYAVPMNSPQVVQRGGKSCVKIEHLDEESADAETEVPAHVELCPCCEGKGSRVNPSIDGHGLSQEDFDEDPDFREDYFSGKYDVECDECDGTGRVMVVDWKGHEQLARDMESRQRADREMRAAEKAERDFGC